MNSKNDVGRMKESDFKEVNETNGAKMVSIFDYDLTNIFLETPRM